MAYDYSELRNAPDVEGSVQGGGRPYVDPGAYMMELIEFDDGDSKQGKRRAHVKMRIIGNGPEDGVELDDYFSLAKRNGKLGSGFTRLKQWWRAMGANPDTLDQVTQEQIEQRLYGKKCIGHVRDEPEPERPRVDDDGNPMLDEFGEPMMWAARDVSRIDFYESAKKAAPQAARGIVTPTNVGGATSPHPTQDTARAAAEEDDSEPTQPVPPAVHEKSQRPEHEQPAEHKEKVAAKKQQAVAAAATADEDDGVWGDAE